MFLIPDSYYKIKIIKNKGRGVFAAKDIPAGTVIGDYLGKVIEEKDEKAFEKKYGLYLFTYTDDSFIAPDLTKKDIYLLNHSCSSNCETFPFKGHILFFALRKIFAGEEITINYGMCSPKMEDTNQYPCYCGSPVCHGTMHISEEKSDSWANFEKKQLGKFFNKREVDFGEMLPPLEKYPDKIEDYGVYDIFGNDNKTPIKKQDKSIPELKKVRSLIRESGRNIIYVKLNMAIMGVMSGLIVVKVLKKTR
jgi:uncharacterized protein